MYVELDYGKKGLTIKVPEKNTKIVSPKTVPGKEDQAGAVRDALRNPIGAPPLRELATAGQTVGIVFNDITRATPNEIIIPEIIEELKASGVAISDITLFNATGTHRTNTDKELRTMLGDYLVDTFTIIQNDARDVDSFIEVGKTDHGKPALLNREFIERDLHILTGFIEPHFFAGFSGGPKAMMPGMASLETVISNHSAEHIDDPNATWGITGGNSLWEEVKSIANLVPSVFLVNVTLNRKKEITEVFAGDLTEAHQKGCEYVKRTAMAAVDEPFDIVITGNSGYPLDLNLYQSVKGMSAASQIVKEGGTIIVVAECWDGIPEHGSYGKLLLQADSIDDLLTTIRSPGFEEGDMWQAHIQALICKKADVYVYSDGLSDKQIEDAMLKPCGNVESLVETLLKQIGPEATICVLPEGPLTIPYVAGA